MKKQVIVGVILMVLLGALLLSAGCSDSSTQEKTSSPTVVKTATPTKVPTTAAPKGIQVKITYPSSWQGAIGYGSNIKSVSGSGTETFSVPDTNIVTVNAQKMDGGSGTLKVEIIEDGKVKASETTNAAYGVAMTSVML